jgi:hypothetical protein
MDEAQETRLLANKILDRINADPDDDLAMLSRQLLRADERIAAVTEALRIACADAWPNQPQWPELYIKRAQNNLTVKTSKLMEKSSDRLGTCDKHQYEHCGPHEKIHEVGQSMPPFPCENWKPLSMISVNEVES